MAADGVSEWYPLAIGDEWTYEHESRNGDARNPDVERWKTVETIRGFLERPEGMIVLREVRTLKMSPNRPGFVITPNGAVQPLRRTENPGSANYLVRGDCIYFLEYGEWDESSQQLAPTFETM